MNILVLNSGSSSLKYKLIRMPEEHLLHSGRIEKIGDPGLSRFYKAKASSAGEAVDCPDHREALKLVFSTLTNREEGCLSRLDQIEAIGHRLVHGKDLFTDPLTLTDQSIKQLTALIELAPLHLPANLACIEAGRKLLPGVPQIAYFDTAFFKGLPPQVYLYPLPWEWYEKYGVRRYGFHGISYEYVTQEASRLLERPREELRLIATHLGNGVSMTAVKENVPVETSMGFTPLEGLMMGTRSGSIDSSIIPYVMKKTGASLEKIMDQLNQESGLLAISGISRDLRPILEACQKGHEKALLAFQMFIQTLRKFLGAYFFTLGGADAIVVTGGIGENAPEVRAALLKDLTIWGIELDEEKNETVINGKTGFINADPGPVKILVVPTDEEIVIARSAYGMTCSKY